MMVSFGNGGVMLGTFLGGYMIRTYGTHAVIWMSILLLAFAVLISFVSEQLDKRFHRPALRDVLPVNNSCG